MSTQPATKEPQTPAASPYDAIGKTAKPPKTPTQKVEPEQKQKDALTLAVQNAQEETRNAKAAIVRDAATTLSNEILNDISAATSMDLIIGLSKTLCGEYGAGTVLRGFLSTTTTSTFQPLDEIENLAPTQPILMSIMQEQKILTAA